jgi:hypothetical protein
MPSQESVSSEVRARTEFAAAVRTGIDALMTRCGYSRERAVHALLKELNRDTASEGKPTDDEVFTTMRKHRLGIDEANRAIIVSRAMRRELLNSTPVLDAIQRLICKISLDNILYESGEESSDCDEDQTEILPLIATIQKVPSSSPIHPSSTTTISSSNRKNSARSKKLTSPRKQPRNGRKGNTASTGSNSSASNSNNTNNNNTILVGRKRSIEDLDANTGTADLETKAANGRPPLRAAKRVHRASAAAVTGDASASAKK